MGFREPLVGEARVRLSGTGQPDIYCSGWISIPRQRHFYRQQPQHPDGEGGDQLPIQLSVSQPILDKLTDALDRTFHDDTCTRAFSISAAGQGTALFGRGPAFRLVTSHASTISIEKARINRRARTSYARENCQAAARGRHSAVAGAAKARGGSLTGYGATSRWQFERPAMFRRAVYQFVIEGRTDAAAELRAPFRNGRRRIGRARL